LLATQLIANEDGTFFGASGSKPSLSSCDIEKLSDSLSDMATGQVMERRSSLQTRLQRAEAGVVVQVEGVKAGEIKSE
jgi:hypothetical protein